MHIHRKGSFHDSFQMAVATGDAYFDYNDSLKTKTHRNHHLIHKDRGRPCDVFYLCSFFVSSWVKKEKMNPKFVKKRVCVFLILLSTGILISAHLFLKYANNTSFVAFPSSTVEIDKVSDSWEGGNSDIVIKPRDSTVSFSYKLKPGFKYPYAGIKLYLAKTRSGGVDLSGYDSMHVALTMSNSDAVRLFLKSYDPAITDTARPNSYLYHEKEFRPGLTPRSASFSMDDFTIPAWWKIQHDYTEEHNGRNLKHVNHIEILNGLSTTLHTSDTVTATLTSISFTGKNGLVRTLIYVVVGLLWFFTLTAVILYFTVKWAQKGMLDDFRSNVVNTYKRVSLKNDEEERRDRLVRFISENYFDPDLTIEILSQKTGINRKVASNLIRKYLDTNFKGYLNQLRLHEASRLLKETDRQITEIALSVGYRNISHFSRIFKEKFGCSPKEFRGGEQNLPENSSRSICRS